ncbi:uncharacterized protein Dwil_GK27725 [Drosophila willistoni]|uniref:Ran GTPase-activating protein n=1 Tax=Drosophila willistoni TaxID=7260 RepID=A0A0Q9WRY9_DROWI|nr:ran GTPase-activating protein [Drosophila willistoni]KRF98896.1 uncharacterized protein Dwil_GK27725 [Drosophila willistoni]
MEKYIFDKTDANLIKYDGISLLEKNYIWDTSGQVQNVVDALKTQKVVNYLELEGNTLGVEAAKAIGEALESHPELQKALWKNLFTSRGRLEVPLALEHLCSGLIKAKAQLTVLDLSYNVLGPNGMSSLGTLMRSPVCYSLQELHLNNCGLGPLGGSMLSSALLALHSNAQKAGSPLQLRVFVCGHNCLQDFGATALARTFKALRTLEQIVLMHNDIRYEGVKYLADSFKANTHLKVINMNDNNFGVNGAAKMAEAFEETPFLREINLGDCLITTEGAYHIADSLEECNDDLAVIDLSFNDLTCDGGLVILSALQAKPKLTYLNLDGNCFGREGRALIIDLMAQSVNASALQPLDEDCSEAEHEDDDKEADEDDAFYA